MNQTTPLLEVSNLSFSYVKQPPFGGEVELTLKDLNFKVKAGEILGILGPNGGGKSTLLKLVTGQLSPLKGSIRFFKEGSIVSRPPMSYIPQKENINTSFPLTIYELLKSARLPYGKVSDKEVKEAVEKVSFEKPLNLKVFNLSGGEYQRVLLAKAFLSPSKIILMDEPTKGLDGVGQDKLLKLIQEFKVEKQAAILLVEHNIAQVLKHSDRLLCLNKTYHWHDHGNKIEKGILENVYHCEFEHLLIHEQKGDILDHHHHHCDDHSDHSEHINEEDGNKESGGAEHRKAKK